ncbi:CRE-EXO-3 protein [Caenorhabditis remanei]|uniref:DNA repair nuclease/redox regulator APEX1 n=1 Tax=Caenorhabditis remanei TaxID=31234 RepID=E3LNA6_CAERE|nr:CRE-EXO-3 protein [Caenorhabditis remanei]
MPIVFMLALIVFMLALMLAHVGSMRGRKLISFQDYAKTLVISTEKNGGYAGVGMFSKTAPLKIHKGIGDPEFDSAGRLIIAEFSKFFFIGSYVPNSGAKLVNLEKRGRWEKLLTEKMKEMNEKKPVIYGGDLNVAHNEIDLKNPESNRNKTAGFTDQERGWFTDMLNMGFTDTFRQMHPESKKYSFWSYLANSREKDVGWRLDYYVVSNRIMKNVRKCTLNQLFELETDILVLDLQLWLKNLNNMSESLHLVLTLLNVSVGNAAYQTTEQELGDYFSSVGQVTNVKIVCDRETGRPRGFAFVEFADEASAQKACEQLNGADFNGRQLRVNLASK